MITIKKVTIRQVSNGYVMNVETTDFRKYEYVESSFEGILTTLYKIQEVVWEGDDTNG